MTDNITLRRAAEQARSALNGWANHGLWAWPESALQTCKQNTEEALAALDAALGADMSATGDDCRQPATEPDAKREPATHGEISEKFYNAGSDRYYRQVDYRHGWRAAERFHGIITKEDKT